MGGMDDRDKSYQRENNEYRKQMALTKVNGTINKEMKEQKNNLSDNVLAQKEELISAQLIYYKRSFVQNAMVSDQK